MGEETNAYRENHEERDNWEDQEVGGWTILKWTLERYNGMVWARSILLAIGTSRWFL
jgi:hypothetical protein